MQFGLVHPRSGSHHTLGLPSWQPSETCASSSVGKAGRDILLQLLCELTPQAESISCHAGHEGYLVGGAVRDLLLGAQPKDFDILTTATPVQVSFSTLRALSIFGLQLVTAPCFCCSDRSDKPHCCRSLLCLCGFLKATRLVTRITASDLRSSVKCHAA